MVNQAPGARAGPWVQIGNPRRKVAEVPLSEIYVNLHQFFVDLRIFCIFLLFRVNFNQYLQMFSVLSLFLKILGAFWGILAFSHAPRWPHFANMTLICFYAMIFLKSKMTKMGQPLWPKSWVESWLHPSRTKSRLHCIVIYFVLLYHCWSHHSKSR